MVFERRAVEGVLLASAAGAVVADFGASAAVVDSNGACEATMGKMKWYYGKKLNTRKFATGSGAGRPE